MKHLKTCSKLHKGILLALAVAVLLASVAVVVYARYTNSQHAQRTIAPYDLSGVRFSSNYLNGGNSRDNVRTLYVTSVLVEPSTSVTVSNFRQREQTHPSDQDITYTLTVRLVRYDAGTEDKYVPVDAAYLSANSLTGYRVTVRKGNASPVTLGDTVVSTQFADLTLPGGSPISDSFTLSFGKSPAFAEHQPNLYVEMIAEPTVNTYPTLRGVFKTGVRAEGASNAWTGAFSDSTAHAPDDYDGLNYRVSGVGSGTFTLRWDPAKVMLSDVSIRELLAISGAERNGNSITFPVNSGTTPQYDLQFYKVDVAGLSWANDMNETLDSDSDPVTCAVGYFFRS